MSYEKIYEDRKICDCGKGLFITEVYENDWKQRKEEKRIDCPICKEFFVYRNKALYRTSKKVLENQNQKLKVITDKASK